MLRPGQQNLRKRHYKKRGNKSSENVQKLKCLTTIAADQNRFKKKKYIYIYIYIYIYMTTIEECELPFT